MDHHKQIMKEILTISQEGARIGCGAMDWIFEQTDTLHNDKVKLFTYLMAIAIMQDKISLARETIRTRDPELDSMVSEALLNLATMRAGNG